MQSQFHDDLELSVDEVYQYFLGTANYLELSQAALVTFLEPELFILVCVAFWCDIGERIFLLHLWVEELEAQIHFQDYNYPVRSRNTAGVLDVWFQIV